MKRFSTQTIFVFSLMILIGLIGTGYLLLANRVPVKSGQIYRYCDKDSCQEVEVTTATLQTVTYTDQNDTTRLITRSYFLDHASLIYEDRP